MSMRLSRVVAPVLACPCALYRTPLVSVSINGGFRPMRPAPFCRATALALAVLVGPVARAEDRLLNEAVEFHGAILYLSTKVPGLVMGAVRNGETAFVGFGEIADGSGREPA